MSMELWGPALDAEIAYRRESLVEGLRRARERRPVRAASAPVGGGARAVRRSRRRWWLLGSGTWHVAR
ncbi:hypothetical protein [Cellulomonas sp. S1-8]|uniref:hypothetical protein n=1 Tax=Cellulomonas sp. S1-8 TaxID=2904790 RepID=UPI0022441144|nr:hypothetical protein [Cellulomonas sp. S1-8]UZN03979.1 hypothetical protein OKX07_03290 [Cellulomonas sp. S1-8]